MQIGINEKLKGRVEKLAHKYGLSLVLIFGSQAREETKRESDIDIAILASKKLSEKDMVYLNFEFTNILPIDRVDLVDIHGAPPLLMKQIADSAKVVYQKTSGEYPGFLIYADRLYREARPLFDLRRARIFSTVKNINKF